jgi:hypothetical protein
MVFNRSRKLILGGTLAALFVAGGVYASTAFAQSTSPTASPSGSNTSQQTFINHLASRLGISDTSKVQQALKDAAKDSVADQVTAGKLTQAQATKIDQRIDSGKGPGFGFAGRPGGARPNGGKAGGPRGAFGGGQILNAAAGAMNMTPQALQQQLQSGKSLKDVAGSNWPAVQQAITTAAKAQFDPLVSSGKMTATQEQNLITRLTSGNFPGRRGPKPSGSAGPAATATP